MRPSLDRAASNSPRSIAGTRVLRGIQLEDRSESLYASMRRVSSFGLETTPTIFTILSVSNTISSEISI